MSGPFIYIGTNTIKEGKVEEARKMLNEITELVKTHEPRVIAFNFYLDEANRTRSACRCILTPHRWTPTCRSSAST